MTDLKISEFVDGGTIQDTDSIAAVRGGVNTKVVVGSMAAEDAADYVQTSALADIAFSGDGADLVAGSVDTAQLANSAVETNQIADDAVTNAKIADNAVQTLQINNNAVTAGKIAAGVVTNAKLANANNLTIKSNISGGATNPSDNTLTQLLDAILGNTRGAVIYRGASAWSKLDPNTAGYILTDGGVGADPSWQANAGSGGGWTYSSPVAVSGLTYVDFTGIPSTAKEIAILFDRTYFNSPGASYLVQLIDTGGVVGTGFYLSTSVMTFDASLPIATSTDAGYIMIAADHTYYYMPTVFLKYWGGTSKQWQASHVGGISGGTQASVHGGGFGGSSNDLTGIRVTSPGGSLAWGGGRIQLAYRTS